MFPKLNLNKELFVPHHLLQLKLLMYNRLPCAINTIHTNKHTEHLLERYVDLHYLLFQTIHSRTIYQVLTQIISNNLLFFK